MSSSFDSGAGTRNPKSEGVPRTLKLVPDPVAHGTTWIHDHWTQNNRSQSRVLPNNGSQQ
ncbi:hypothetical protein C8R44DRAFT_823692 [Mycena epipterygia]|nr:hypothetical protein C8R44DRAFT_823692 [Mycena epipterygia]